MRRRGALVAGLSGNATNCTHGKHYSKQAICSFDGIAGNEIAPTSARRLEHECSTMSSPAKLKRVTIDVEKEFRVSGLLQYPNGARACYVLAHGAGAGMAHPFMVAVAAELADR